MLPHSVRNNDDFGAKSKHAEQLHMTKELLLLRHGKSDWTTNVDDFHRPIKTRGKIETQKIGIWLAQNNKVPDYVISSPAVRALTTAQKVCKAMGFNSLSIIQDDDVYLADHKTLIEVIQSCPAEVNRLLIVGHNPGLEELLMLYAHQQLEVPEDDNIFPTATLALFSVNGRWDQISAKKSHFSNLLRGRDLTRKFPFPDENSTEYRDRPAYYYSQSSVIPYRIEPNNLEFLVIRSSGGKRWIFPKGISDPDMSPQKSAAKEALEEAGVIGVPDNKELGEYSIDKWGSTCQVLVYPMEVTQIIPQDKWEESYRGRKWLKLEDVCQLIKSPDLVTMLNKLSKRLVNNT